MGGAARAGAARANRTGRTVCNAGDSATLGEVAHCALQASGHGRLDLEELVAGQWSHGLVCKSAQSSDVPAPCSMGQGGGVSATAGAPSAMSATAMTKARKRVIGLGVRILKQL